MPATDPDQHIAIYRESSVPVLICDYRDVASAERMAVDGVADLINHVQRIMWNKFSLNHQELRILFTMYRSTTSHSPAIVANAKKIWRDNVLSMKVPHTTLFAQSYDEKKPVRQLDPQHPGSLAYDVFADWLISYETT